MRINEKVSVLVPVYNMEGSIEDAVDKAMRLLKTFLNNFEIILSNDGSADETLSVLRSLEKKYEGVIRIASVSVNHGKGHALKKAFEISKGEYIAFCDADMELSPDQLESFFDIMERENADIVIGSKRHPDSKVHYSGIRKVISSIYFYFVKIFFQLPIRDTQTGLKLFKREVLARVFPRMLVKAFAYDLECLAAAYRNGYSIAEAPINLLAVRNFGMIPFKTLWQTFKDTLAIFYRLNIVKFYDRLFSETDMRPLVSIIIPLKKINSYIRQTTEALKKQIYQNYELIILPDEADEEFFNEKIFKQDNIRIIKTGAIPPAFKRHKGANEARGEYLSFLDDDTYPETDWLYNAIRAFDNEKVKVLGGPAVNAPDDSFFQEISGLVYSSVLVSGNYAYRYVSDKVRYVNDYPSCNLIIEKELYFRLGGFDSEYWPGEDTVLCQKIIDAGEKILYTPEALVYHHRRHIFKGHFKQISSYAWHRGYFVREIGGNSLSLSYFIPSLFLLYVLAFIPIMILSARLPYANILRIALTLPILLYAFLLIITSAMTFSPLKAAFTGLGIFLSHISYGFNFIKGILKVKK